MTRMDDARRASEARDRQRRADPYDSLFPEYADYVDPAQLGRPLCSDCGSERFIYLRNRAPAYWLCKACGFIDYDKAPPQE